MQSEWHILHRIEVSNLINLLREHETNTITRNVMRYNNRDDLLNLNFILKIQIFSEVYLPSRTSMIMRFFGKIVGVGRGKSSKPNPSKVSQVQLGGLGVLYAAPVGGVLGQSPLTKIVSLSKVPQIGLKSIHIWWYSSSFCSSIFLMFFL